MLGVRQPLCTRPRLLGVRQWWEVFLAGDRVHIRPQDPPPPPLHLRDRKENLLHRARPKPAPCQRAVPVPQPGVSLASSCAMCASVPCLRDLAEKLASTLRIGGAPAFTPPPKPVSASPQPPVEEGSFEQCARWLPQLFTWHYVLNHLRQEDARPTSGGVAATHARA